MAFLVDAKLYADNLRYYRTLNSYTQQELANLCVLPVHMIADLESGKLVPGRIAQEVIAARLHVKQETMVMPRSPEQPYFEGC